MKHSTWFRIAFLLLAAAGALVIPRPVLANPIVPFTLAFEREGLDLDTGTIVPIELWTLTVNPADPQPDLVLGYNSERAVCAVVFQNRMNGVQIAFLDGVAFNMVDSADLAGLSFTAAMIDDPFETGDSVVLRTDTGAHYLLGNPIEDATGVTFDTQLLDETTAGLVRSKRTILARGGVSRNETPLSASTSFPSELSTEDLRQIRALIEEDGYRFRPVSAQPGTFTTRNVAHGLRAELDGSGLRLSSSMNNDWDWNLALVAYGYAGALRPVGPGELVAQENRLEHRRDDLIEWYVNDGRGLEQGFTLAGPPAGEREGALSLRLASSGSLAPVVEDDSGVRLIDAAGRTVLRYAGLLAWDATGRELPARLAAEAGGLTIKVDDAGAVYPVTIDPTVVQEDAKLTASDAADLDRFGVSVALSGDTAVVGAIFNDHAGGTNAGSAYVFLRSGTSWSEQAKLTASDAGVSDSFGWSVAISGDTAVVGAIFDTHAGDLFAGSAYVFQRSGTSWSEQAKLTASDAADLDRFGISVALSGDTAVVGTFGAHDAGGFGAGSAYVFVRSGTTWSEQAKLTASDAADLDRFGISVALSGDTAVVGARLDDHAGGTNAGSAYVFVRSGTSWSEQAKLTASDAAGGDQFGISVALLGDTAVVGAIFNDHADGTNAGSAYVFQRSGTSWSEQAKLTASDAAGGDQFGISVALSGDTAVVGAFFDDHAGDTNAGSAYVFVSSGTTWSEQAKLTASDAAAGDSLGFSVALSGDTAVVGAFGDDHADGTNAGSAYVFTVCGAVDTTAPQLSVTLTPDTLWPPNHHMVEITATVTASDNCGAPTIALASLTSNEADDALGKGDGKTTGDIQPGADDFHFSLRSERAGTGDGRIYTAVYTATDASGNVASEAGFVVVPHDQGSVIDPMEIALVRSPSGTVVFWPAVSGAESYDVIRGELNNIVDTGVVINLGTVVCIEANSMDESTLGWEDGELPEPGRAFFYVVEYYDGISSSYGTESADKPRASGPGDCQ